MSYRRIGKGLQDLFPIGTLRQGSQINIEVSVIPRSFTWGITVIKAALTDPNPHTYSHNPLDTANLAAEPVPQLPSLFLH
jgi:hypothetical protein